MSNIVITNKIEIPDKFIKDMLLPVITGGNAIQNLINLTLGKDPEDTPKFRPYVPNPEDTPRPGPSQPESKYFFMDSLDEKDKTNVDKCLNKAKEFLTDPNTRKAARGIMGLVGVKGAGAENYLNEAKDNIDMIISGTRIPKERKKENISSNIIKTARGIMGLVGVKDADVENYLNEAKDNIDMIISGTPNFAEETPKEEKPKTTNPKSSDAISSNLLKAVSSIMELFPVSTKETDDGFKEAGKIIDATSSLTVKNAPSTSSTKATVPANEPEVDSVIDDLLTEDPEEEKND